MKKANPDSKPAARPHHSTPSFRKTRSLTKAFTWAKGLTSLTTQLPTPTPAMEEVTPLAASNISSTIPGNPKDSSSTRSIISSIETAALLQYLHINHLFNQQHSRPILDNNRQQVCLVDFQTQVHMCSVSQ